LTFSDTFIFKSYVNGRGSNPPNPLLGTPLARIALDDQSFVSSCQVGPLCRPGELGDDPARGRRGEELEMDKDKEG